jgi:hypothetical protein
MKIRRLSQALALALSTACVVALTALPSAADSSDSYVAFGDSYVSGSGVFPIARGSNPACTQTSLNAPHLVAQQLGLALTDVSCGGATVQNFTQPQFGFVPPQFDALKPTTSVVSLSIGGNDNGLFATAIAACGGLNLGNIFNIGSPCKDASGSYFDKKIDADAPNIGAALTRIHELSPNANVFVVGYPRILPASGNCYPQIPVGTGDVAYLDGIERHVNSMLAAQAAAHGATFVDTYGPSTGHDACKSPSVRWIEPAFPKPSPNGFPVLHPNVAGLAGTAVALKAAFIAAGIG